jgi:hypothetical protein
MGTRLGDRKHNSLDKIINPQTMGDPINAGYDFFCNAGCLYHPMKH